MFYARWSINFILCVFLTALYTMVLYVLTCFCFTLGRLCISDSLFNQYHVYLFVCLFVSLLVCLFIYLLMLLFISVYK